MYNVPTYTRQKYQHLTDRLSLNIDVFLTAYLFPYQVSVFLMSSLTEPNLWGNILHDVIDMQWDWTNVEGEWGYM